MNCVTDCGMGLWVNCISGVLYVGRSFLSFFFVSSFLFFVCLFVCFFSLFAYLFISFSLSLSFLLSFFLSFFFLSLSFFLLGQTITDLVTVWNRNARTCVQIRTDQNGFNPSARSFNPSVWFAVPVSSGHLNPLLRFDEKLSSACRHNFNR
jgi:hypothetical protein